MYGRQRGGERRSSQSCSPVLHPLPESCARGVTHGDRGTPPSLPNMPGSRGHASRGDGGSCRDACLFSLCSSPLFLPTAGARVCSAPLHSPQSWGEVPPQLLSPSCSLRTAELSSPGGSLESAAASLQLVHVSPCFPSD